MKKKSPFILEEIINNIPYFIFWKDKDLNYLGVNQPFAESAGYANSDEMIGKCDYDCCWTKDEADFFRKIDKEVMDSGQPILNIEEPQKQLDGSTRTLLTSKVPLRDEAGDVVGILGIYADITDRKELENEKDLAIAELKKIQQLLVHQEKMKSLGEMAGGIAHEINNPMSVISANAVIIKKMLEEGHDKKSVMKACDSILKTVDRCKDIIDNLKHFSRDSNEVKVELTNGKNIIHTVMSLLSQRCRENDHKLQVDSNDTHFRCKQLSIEQSLLNLVVNAFDEVDGDDEGKVIVRTFSRNNHVGVEVLNTGPEIPLEIRERCFEPFFTTKEIGRGTGLGLSTSKGLVEKCGGELIYQRLDGMNAFSIVFPKVHLVEVSDMLSDEKSRLRILAVDDEEELVEVLQSMLELYLDCEVVTFCRAAEAFDYVKNNQVDLVISDIRMPEMDGVSLLEKIRDYNSESPMVVLMSGYSEYSEEDLKAKGASCLLSKPFNPEEIINFIKENILTEKTLENSKLIVL